MENFCKLLSKRAENLGVNIFPGFVATRALFNKKGVVVDVQTGDKELWRISPKKHKKGAVIHTVGWPSDRKTYGRSFNLSL